MLPERARGDVRFGFDRITENMDQWMLRPDGLGKNAGRMPALPSMGKFDKMAAHAI
jgi:hypothetical protein